MKSDDHTKPQSLTATVTLEQLAQEIRDLRVTAGKAIIGIGERLVRAKVIAGYGNWLPWLESNFQWSASTATRFMQVAEAFKSCTVHDLDGLTIDAKALYYLSGKSVTEDTREKAIAQAKQGKAVTLADAKKLNASNSKPDSSKVKSDEPELGSKEWNEKPRTVEVIVVERPEPEPRTVEVIYQPVVKPEPKTINVVVAEPPRKSLAEELDGIGKYAVGVYHDYEYGKVEFRSRSVEEVDALRVKVEEAIGNLADLKDILVSNERDPDKMKRQPSKYTVAFTVTGTNIVSIRKQVATAFPTCSELQVERPSAEGGSRVARLAGAEASVDNGKAEVEQLRSEIDEWRNNLPENFQQGEKAYALEACSDQLQAILDSLEQVEGWDDVEFPSMMG